MKKERGRPVKYKDGDVIVLDARRVKTRRRLNANSDRRALVNAVIAAGGKATIAELNEHFGFCVRSIVYALENAGWLSLEDKDEQNQ